MTICQLSDVPFCDLTMCNLYDKKISIDLFAVIKLMTMSKLSTFELVYNYVKGTILNYNYSTGIVG